MGLGLTDYCIQALLLPGYSYVQFKLLWLAYHARQPSTGIELMLYIHTVLSFFIFIIFVYGLVHCIVLLYNNLLDNKIVDENNNDNNYKVLLIL